VAQPVDTVDDFGKQWTRYRVVSADVESDEFFQDILGPLMTLQELEGQSVADVGAGNGRFTTILARRARRVLSIEPSEAMSNNIERNSAFENVEFLQARAEELDVPASVDVAFCIGVLHHIPDMVAALAGMRRLLRPGGRVVVWVYGREGNSLYLMFAHALRSVTVHLPDRLLHAISGGLVLPIKVYGRCCASATWLPMAAYFNKVLGRCDAETLRVNVFDQLNPRTARYLTRADLFELLSVAGFEDSRFHHRHGYSWTAIATRPSHGASA
jgi:SAM-dependent methyltransferase